MQPTRGHHASHHQAMSRQGEIILFGDLVWPRPYFPSAPERAALLRDALPTWVIVSGTTAGWVWTGMGMPEPWCVLRVEKPGLSPLERTKWRAALWSPVHHSSTRLAGLTLLDKDCTAREVLLGSAPVDVAVAQLLFLTRDDDATLRSRCGERRASATQRKHAERVLERLAVARGHYPDITR
jgi:hypothetical protein